MKVVFRTQFCIHRIILNIDRFFLLFISWHMKLVIAYRTLRKFSDSLHVPILGRGYTTQSRTCCNLQACQHIQDYIMWSELKKNLICSTSATCIYDINIIYLKRKPSRRIYNTWQFNSAKTIFAFSNPPQMRRRANLFVSCCRPYWVHQYTMLHFSNLHLPGEIFTCKGVKS